MMPDQKSGMETPTREMMRLTWSTHLSRCTAEATPRMMPNTTAMSIAASVSSSVAGKYFASSSDTGIWVRMEMPISPWKRPVIYWMYCVQIG